MNLIIAFISYILQKMVPFQHIWHEQKIFYCTNMQENVLPVFHIHEISSIILQT